MKRVLFSIAILAAAVATAEDISSSNVLGLLPVTSSARRTIVSVPWCAMSATDNESIQASNIVKTANLTVNDTLHVYSGSAFNTWKLAEGADGVLYWQSVKQVSEAGTVTETPSSANQQVARGTAILLVRQNATNENGTAKTFYLYGQVGSGAVTSEITSRGTSAEPAYSLVAPSSVTNVNLCATGVCSSIAEGDEIQIPNNKGAAIQFMYTNSVWKTYTYSEGSWSWIAVDPITVKPGKGFWYISKSNGGSNPVFNW